MVEVPLTPGMVALAGLNGAGKSRILDGLRAALTYDLSYDGVWELVVKVVDGEDDGSALTNIAKYWMSPHEGQRSTDAAWRSDLAGAIADRIERYAQGSVDEPEAVAAAMAEQGVFVMTFANEEHLLEVKIAIDRRSENPALVRLISQMDDAWEALVDSDDPYDYESLGAFGPDDSHWGPESVNPVAADTLPIPISRLAVYNPAEGWSPRPPWADDTAGKPFDVVTIEDATDVNSMTRELLSRLLVTQEDALTVLAQEQSREAEWLDALKSMAARFSARVAHASETSAPSGLLEAIEELSLRAMAWFTKLTGQVAAVRCRLHPIHTWLGPGEGFAWEMLDPPTGHTVGLDDLSAFQGRWMRLAILIALREVSAGTTDSIARSRDMRLFIDEPELGVHRAAERKLATALRDLGTRFGIHVVVATHSPAMISAAHLPCVVARDQSGYINVSPLPSEAVQVADALGLDVTDLLGWYQRILFVEGAHDEAVVKTLLADVLDSTRTLVIAIRGVKDAGKTVDARLLEFSDAPVVIMVDGLGPDARETWEHIRQLAGTGNLKSARELAKERYTGDSFEAKFLREVAELLLRTGSNLERFTIHALAAKDIIELLPAEQLLDGKTTWPEARRRYEAARTTDDFKKWIAHTYRRGRAISVNGVQKAAETMDAIPGDLEALARLLHDVGTPESGL